jgi:hypothetical protein
MRLKFVVDKKIITEHAVGVKVYSLEASPVYDEDGSPFWNVPVDWEYYPGGKLVFNADKEGAFDEIPNGAEFWLDITPIPKGS